MKENELNVVFCGYRSWALEAISVLSANPQLHVVDIISSKEEYDQKIGTVNDKIDVILFIGWSWIVAKDVVRKFLCLGVHPSDLPDFRGGSPLQHQIISGIKDSKLTLFTISDKLDAGDIWLKGDLNLRGDSMNVVLEQLKESTISLIENFFDRCSALTPVSQELEKGSYFPRRTEDMSRITADFFSDNELIHVYNFFRCLTDPYPNAFMEDSQGNRLYITGVKYEPVAE
ncbi:formyltransferase family protein [Schleiferiaceae bacterium]|nr:formyltransferase family protein [Schleiferiaceae bacterium]